MAIFKSPEVIVTKKAEYLFNKIGNLNNLKNIMPSEIEDFESTESTCSFKMKGMPKLALEISEKIEFSKISLTTTESQVAFSLNCFIIDKGEVCQARLEINAEINMMMEMMIKKPLTQFLNLLASRMEEI